MRLQPSAPGGRVTRLTARDNPEHWDGRSAGGSQSEAHAETPRVICLAPDPSARAKNTVADFAQVIHFPNASRAFGILTARALFGPANRAALLRFPLFAWFFDGAGLVPERCLS
jgi:hypothetical protein